MQSVVFSNSLFDYSVPLNKLFLHSKLSSSVNNIFVLYFLTQSCYFGSDRNYSERRRWVIIPCYNRMDNDPYRDHHHARATKLHKVSFVDPHGAHRAFCPSRIKFFNNLSTMALPCCSAQHRCFRAHRMGNYANWNIDHVLFLTDKILREKLIEVKSESGVRK